MTMPRVMQAAAVLLSVMALGTGAEGAVSNSQLRSSPPPVVTVTHAGNAGELSGYGAGGTGPDRVCGAVAYEYEIGKYEVTAAEYVTFLNAVAATDPYQLYDARMTTHSYGCRIERTGNDGDYAYSVPEDWAARPVNFVTWGDAARYANWLTNDMRVGTQGPLTTEDGSYAMNGAMTDAELLAVKRAPGAKYVIPSEDEWYKAAYFEPLPDKRPYWDYPTQSDWTPANALLDPDPGNNANYYLGGYTVGHPYYRTEVGAFSNSESGFGTYDQGGNVKEWTEAILWIGADKRGTRGGSCFYGETELRADKRIGMLPASCDNDLGFRIALVPEPGSLTLLLLPALMRRRR